MSDQYLRYTYGNTANLYKKRNYIYDTQKDNTCVIFKGNQLIYASEVERYTKEKYDGRHFKYPLLAFQKKHPLEDIQFEWVENVHQTHHTNHIYEVFYQSGFKEAAVYVNDGCGTEHDCITLAYMKENEKPIILRKFSSGNSISGEYNEAAKAIFNQDHSEGKMMGLASYGKPFHHNYFYWNNETKNIDHTQFYVAQDIKEYKSDNLLTIQNIAYTYQKDFENISIEIIKYFKELLLENGIETDNLCLSGGGIYNCPTNSKIIDLGLFKHYYASSNPGDGGAESIGAMYRIIESKGLPLESVRRESPYLGVDYIEDERELHHCMDHMRLVLLKNLDFSWLCHAMRYGNIIAWYQGGAEFGPRALGHRSFLADPCYIDTLYELNKIKNRESWRPLAPIVPEELFHIIFDVENTDLCEFMLRTLTIKEEWKPKLKAICHVDGTTRPQLLKKEVNPQLYDLIMTYYRLYKIPCLVNTSLNINGYPIVETPDDFIDLKVQLHDDKIDGRVTYILMCGDGQTYGLGLSQELHEDEDITKFDNLTQ